MANKKPKGSGNKAKTNQSKEKTKSGIVEDDAIKTQTKSAKAKDSEEVEAVVADEEDVEEVEIIEEEDDDEDEELDDEADEDKDDEDEDKKDDEEDTVVFKTKITTTKVVFDTDTNGDKSSDDEPWYKGFFARKYEGKEGILTVFKQHKFYGALLGEIIGTCLVTILLFALSLMGIHSLGTYVFAVIAIYVAIYAFSGACLNPIVTAGMMATRRISVIRGVMYIVAEVLGAWLGWLIFNAFHLTGGDTAYAVPTMTAVGENQFWMITMVELLGAILIAFFFARALKYRRSAFTFGATVAGGMVFAVILGYVISAAFLSLSNNFIFNPAAALMFQIFPTEGEGFGEIIGGICQALSIYAIFPMIGGVVGFYLSDFTARLSGEKE